MQHIEAQKENKCKLFANVTFCEYFCLWLNKMPINTCFGLFRQFIHLQTQLQICHAYIYGIDTFYTQLYIYLYTFLTLQMKPYSLLFTNQRQYLVSTYTDRMKRQGANMEGYTITKAAALLSTTRQTIYNRIKKNPESYTIETADGKTLITLQGLGLLKESLNATPGRRASTVDTDKTNNRQNHTIPFDEIQRLEKVNAAQADELLKLSNRVNELSSKIVSLEADKAYLQGTLDKAIDRLTDTSKPIGLWQKLLGRGKG